MMVMWCLKANVIYLFMLNVVAIDKAISKIKKESFVPFLRAGNQLTRNLYRMIRLLWIISSLVPDFDKIMFFKKEWGIKGNGESFLRMGI